MLCIIMDLCTGGDLFVKITDKVARARRLAGAHTGAPRRVASPSGAQLSLPSSWQRGSSTFTPRASRIATSRQDRREMCTVCSVHLEHT
jgi:hypothetical protein